MLVGLRPASGHGKSDDRVVGDEVSGLALLSKDKAIRPRALMMIELFDRMSICCVLRSALQWRSESSVQIGDVLRLVINGEALDVVTFCKPVWLWVRL